MSKERSIPSTGKALRMCLTSALLWLLVISLSRADGVTPTNEWINLYSLDSTLYGKPLPEGAVVAVYGSDGTKCGEMAVTLPGWYGTLPCYRSDSSAQQGLGSADAGMQSTSAEDTLSFTINGHPVQAVPRSLNGNPVPLSSPITWTYMGDLWQVDLHGTSESRIVGGHTVYGGPVGPLFWGLLSAVITALVALVTAHVALLHTRHKRAREN